jgi:alkanesulfonate monooxygenase SsuD/methylene tetrahydromethanopterin reductase-like flavin-dependent oxidoreductase (luciferase family)
MEPLWQDAERVAVENRLRAAIVGSDSTVKAGLQALVSGTQADEVIVVTETYEHEARLQSYQRVADIAPAIRLKSSATVGA